MIIVYACLAGLNCRYDGGSKSCKEIIRMVAQGEAIPVCPEQWSGLTTPKLPAEQVGEKVIRKDGMDVTEAFDRGAQEALMLAKLVGAGKAILKAGSPSCGCRQVHDGSFTGTLVNGDGVLRLYANRMGSWSKQRKKCARYHPGLFVTAAGLRFVKR